MNKDLPPEVIEAISEYYSGELADLKDRYTETNWRLTQHNFLTNAGGAVAVLGYMGSVGAANFAIWPLMFFVAGILASGLEIRALLSAYSGLHKELNMRSEVLASGATNLEAIIPVSRGLAGNINVWAGMVCQFLFAAGVITGVLLFVYSLNGG